MKINKTKSYKWSFAKFGGVTQLQLKSGEDLLHLRELDLKLWTALSIPAKGIFFDAETAKILDSDNDGSIKPEEILSAVDWICANLKHPDILFQEGSAVPINEIKNQELAFSAQTLLTNINKQTENAISVDDVYTQKKFFTEHVLTKSVEISDDAPSEEKLQKVLEAIIASMSYKDIDNGTAAESVLDTFYKQADVFLKWNSNLPKDGTLPLAPEQTEKALSALRAVEEKINDFFIRCKLAQYEPNAKSSLCADSGNFKNLITQNLNGSNEFLQSLPLASPDEIRPLPLNEGINPAWADKICAFSKEAVTPLLGNLQHLSENNWNEIQEKLAGYASWQKSKPQVVISKITPEYLEEMIKPEQKEKLLGFIKKNISIEIERGRICELEKLVLFRRDILRLLNNSVTFSDFYEGKGSIFQAGVLYFDSRSADLCFYLTEDERHTNLDPMTGSFLVYCSITRKGETKKLLAMFTNGASNTIVVGRNGVFYDREGNEWNAAVTKVVINPISLREAFFMPYRKFSAMIEEQIAKRAAEADKKSEEKLAQTAAAVASVDRVQTADKTASPKKLDLGTIALLGTAIGGVSALVSGILQALFGLGFLLPLGIIGIILIISGPSTVLAALKLRKRSIGPILEANGWAINTQLKINIPFGGSMTQLGVIPPESGLMAHDPFAEKKTGKKWFIAVLIIAAIITAAVLILRFGFNMSVKDLFKLSVIKS